MGKSAVAKLADLTSGQWGLVTTAQAENAGIGRLQLSRMAKAGHLRRMRHGVYMDSGAPEDRYTLLKSHWLALKPEVAAFERLKKPEQDFVVIETTAAWMHQVGDFFAAPFSFASGVRFQPRDPIVRVRKRQCKDTQIELLEGLPVTTPNQTFVDLILGGQDLDSSLQVARDFGNLRINLQLVTDSLSEAVKTSGIINAELRQKLDELAKELKPGRDAFAQLANAAAAVSAAAPKLELPQELTEAISKLKEAVDNLNRLPGN